MTRFVRVWLPVGVLLAAAIAFALNPTMDGLEGAAHIVGAGLAIWLLNLLIRIGISGEKDRDAEDAARAYFDEHGYWPDEAPAEPPAPAARAAPPAHRAPDPHARRARPAPRHRGGDS